MDLVGACFSSFCVYKLLGWKEGYRDDWYPMPGSPTGHDKVWQLLLLALSFSASQQLGGCHGLTLAGYCFGPCSVSSTRFCHMGVPAGTAVLLRAEFKVIAKAAAHHSSDTYVCFCIEQLSLNTYLRFQCSTQSELSVLLFLFGHWLKRDQCTFMASNKDIASGNHIRMPGSNHSCGWQSYVIFVQPDCWAYTKIKPSSSHILIMAIPFLHP